MSRRPVCTETSRRAHEHTHCCPTESFFVDTRTTSITRFNHTLSLQCITRVVQSKMAPSPTTPTPSPLSPQTPTDYSNIPTDVLINNLTVDYDSVNAMATPWIDGTPTCTKNLPEESRVIDNPIRNFDNYGIAYPITGKLFALDDTAGGKQGGQAQSAGPVAPNGYYQGPDYSLGSNYFEVMGKCGADSDPECVGADRAVYIRNITTGRPPLFGDESLASITGSTKFLASNGIIPTVLDNLSTFLPGNLIENVFENTGNFGGSKCRRVKLPVGAHIYDPTMKIPLDYCAINECDSEKNPPNLKVRQARTRKQVESMVSGVPYSPAPTPSSSNNENTVWWAGDNQSQHPRSWWFEEHCSPSFHYAVVPDDWIQNPSLFADCANGESTALPSAKPLLSTAPSLAKLPPAPACSPAGSCPAQAPYSPPQAPTPAQINACQNQQAPFEGFTSPTIQPTQSSHTLHSLHTLYRVILIIVIVALMALLGWWWFHTSRTR